MSKLCVCESWLLTNLSCDYVKHITMAVNHGRYPLRLEKVEVGCKGSCTNKLYGWIRDAGENT